MRWSEISIGWKVLVFGFVFLFFCAAAVQYKGNVFYYSVFSLIANAMLYFCFRDRAIFFDTFIGLFFWLGFWVKLTFRIVFMKGEFVLAGHFDGSPESLDTAVLVSSCGLSGLLLASYLRSRFVFNYPQVSGVDSQQGLFEFYVSYRKLILMLFFVFMVFVGFFNVYFGIYQRGELVKTILPFGLNGVITWLLLFGMASVVAIFLNFELRINKDNYWWVIVYSFLEGVISNVSQLSRGMVISTGSLLYGVFVNFRREGFKVGRRFLLSIVCVFFILFASSAVMVTYVRNASYIAAELDAQEQKKSVKNVMADSGPPETQEGGPLTAGQVTVKAVASLLVDRWVGVEGVMAVSSYPALGWGLWRSAWAEVYNENSLSFYDQNLIDSDYKNTDTSRFHFVSLSGIVAFFFYPGSYLFLFFSMLGVGLLGAAIEIFVFRFGGRNIILCSLFSQIVAYRCMSFGYVPGQSYLLFGTIFCNVILIYLADKGLGYWRSRFES
ncbi:hypothetical protein HX867_03815 [Pseudomonas gingeri]|uniref:hypothetical protein n=1 Tax=Pseudomonas gingeri TaxID=117681 RepID=UPI0015A2E6F0|nr:hypothetical protein [Pseudomonas gingeri]NVZ61200.1 hypothetical protein [Pseudomonas gingeri]NVZ73753.1 hypothetical protein [Pseudomonas gingeri]